VISDLEKRNVWLSFASSALSSLAGKMNKSYDLEDLEEDVLELADGLLDAFCEKFDPDYVPPEPEEDDEQDEAPRQRRRSRR
jgi:hypothetical protein